MEFFECDSTSFLKTDRTDIQLISFDRFVCINTYVCCQLSDRTDCNYSVNLSSIFKVKRVIIMRRALTAIARVLCNCISTLRVICALTEY